MTKPGTTRWARARRWISVGVALLVILGLAAAIGFVLWIRVPPIDSDTPAAVALFTRVLHGEGAVRAQAIGSLAGAVDRAPGDATAHLWFGLANMHTFLDTRELPYAIRATRALDRAAELAPSDGGNAGWRAFWRYQVARARGDDLDAARTALLDASARDPRFTPFLAAVALAPMAISSGYPERVLAPLEAIEDCGDGTSHSCRTSPLFPHGAEGFHATLGDLRVRLGDLEGGRAQYARALEMESAATWPHRAAFESWIEGADERARLLTNDDPDDDPTIFFASGERACAACHESAGPP